MRLTLALSAIVVATACSAQPLPAGAEPFVRTIVADFDNPRAMTFLPDKRMLVAEKDGRLFLLSADGKARTTVAGVPAFDSAGQGGMMDVIVHPGFARNRVVYFSGSQAGQGGKGIVLVRAQLAEDRGSARLEKVQTLFRGAPLVDGDGHYSGKMAFSPDGKYLFFPKGERQKFTPAQDKKATLGKVLRLLPNGQPAPGNPLAAQGFHPAVWSYGHRNLLGLAFDRSGNLWENEMGPQGGDEVNLVLPGRNYGWPNVSNGSHYSGKDIPDHAAGDGYEPPKVWWNPSISPAGMMIYSGKLFPQWKGDAFIGGLSSQALLRVDIDGTSAAKGDQWAMSARIREVEEAPDGAIVVLEDGGSGSQGRMIRLTPQ